MSIPLLGALAYAAFTNCTEAPVVPWGELPFSVRIAWGKAAHAAVVAAHTVPCGRHVEIEDAADLWQQARRKGLRHNKAHAGARAPKGPKSKRAIRAA